MPDLDARALVDSRERVGDRPQLGGELLVRQAGDVHAPVAVGEVGDRLHPEQGQRKIGGLVAGVVRNRQLAPALEREPGDLARRVRQPHARVRHVLERDDLDLARPVDAQQDRRGPGALPAHDRDERVARLGIDRQVRDQHAGRVGPEHGRDLLVDGLDVRGARLAAAEMPAQVERVDEHVLGIGSEQHPVGAEGHRPEVRELRPDAGRHRGFLGDRRAGRGDRQHQREQQLS